MTWLWLGLGLVFLPLTVVVLLLAGLHIYLCWRYLHLLVRIFQEKPLFIIPRGQPMPGAEDVRLPTPDGLTLFGCYLRTTAARRRGVILFGLEYGSNRWACLPYCEHLLANGFDVFAVEARGQGDTPAQPGYEPLQWLTNYEVQDLRTAIEFLKHRPDADPRGIGFFGISKGGNAGLLAAADEPYVRCFVTDGIFGTYSTMVPYMRKWFSIYNNHYRLQGLLPPWYYGLVGLIGLRRIERAKGFKFMHLERVMPRLAPRPLLMIHGGGDTYVRTEMARPIFELAREPKEFWLVENAKHNLALQVAGDEYRRRVLTFFEKNLAEPPAPPSAQPVPTALAESA